VVAERGGWKEGSEAGQVLRKEFDKRDSDMLGTENGELGESIFELFSTADRQENDRGSSTHNTQAFEMVVSFFSF